MLPKKKKKMEYWSWKNKNIKGKKKKKAIKVMFGSRLPWIMYRKENL